MFFLSVIEQPHEAYVLIEVEDSEEEGAVTPPSFNSDSQQQEVTSTIVETGSPARSPFLG